MQYRMKAPQWKNAFNTFLHRILSFYSFLDNGICLLIIVCHYINANINKNEIF